MPTFISRCGSLTCQLNMFKRVKTSQYTATEEPEVDMNSVMVL